MRYLILLLLFIVSMTVLAEPLSEPVATKDAEIRQLEKTMARISQESQATYQQFLMTQELRRNEMLESPDTIPLNLTGKSIPIPSYEDLMRRRQEKNDRMERYSADLDRLYTRYKELESEREAIFEKIKSLERKTTEE
ncbi:hypothetical protein [Nitrosomonas sp.]|uniref:hypothetical protein n=1 Tax=Nitrosomonas sp. TaxID=42353 RepID=UPI002623DE0B|nr:hypothetical protein [Nitrosomonas sp.]